MAYRQLPCTIPRNRKSSNGVPGECFAGLEFGKENAICIEATAKCSDMFKDLHFIFNSDALSYKMTFTHEL